MECTYCNFKTTRTDHFLRHENTEKHNKNKYYETRRKRKMKDRKEVKEETVDDNNKELEEDEQSLMIPIIETEVQLKEEPKLKSKDECLREISNIIRLFNNKKINYKKYVLNNDYYYSNIKTLNTYELNDYLDELEYVKNKIPEEEEFIIKNIFF